SWKRAAENPHAELAHHQAGEVTGDRAVVADLGDDRRRALALGDERQPLARLEHDAVGESIERLPLNFVRLQPSKLHHAAPPSHASKRQSHQPRTLRTITTSRETFFPRAIAARASGAGGR